MKAILYCVVVIASVLMLCFIVSLVKSKTKGKRMPWTNLIFPLIALLLFVGLFVGSSISRSSMRKELTEMKNSSEKRVDNTLRIKALEKRNKQLDIIIGRDEETEKLFDEVLYFDVVK